MANVIEVVLRGKDELRSTLQGSAQEVRNFRQTLTDVTLAAAPFIAAIGAAIAMVKSFADESEKLANLSTIIGTSARNIAVMREALSEQGIAADESTQALAFLNRQIAMGNPLLEALGIHTKDAYQAALQLSDAFAGSGDAATKALIAQGLLGRGSVELVAALGTLRQTVGDVAGSMTSMNQAEFAAAQSIGAQTDTILDRAHRKWADLYRQVQTVMAAIFVSISGGESELRNLMKSQVSNALAGAGVMMLPGHGSGIADATSDALAKAAAKAAEIAKQREAAAKAAADEAASQAKIRKDMEATQAMFTSMAQAYNPTVNPTAGMQPRGAVRPLSLPGTVDVADTDWQKRLSEGGKKALEYLDRLQAAAQGAAQGIESAFTAAFVGIFTATMSIGQAVRSFIRGIYEAIMKMIADMIAKLVAIGILNFVGSFFGMPNLGDFATGGASTPRGISPSPVGGASLAPIMAPGLVARGGDTFVIQTFDSYSTLSALTSPGGSFRRANDRLAVVGSLP